MTFLLFCLIVWLGWSVWKTRKLMQTLEQDLSTARLEAAGSFRLAQLTERVRQLERRAIATAEPTPEAYPDAAPAPAPAREQIFASPEAGPANVEYAETEPVELTSGAAASKTQEPLSPPKIVPGPSLADRLRGMLGNREWEMLVGGNLLNKLGALVLVIGIALFLGYSFGRVTPTARATAAVLIGVAILGAGIRLEKQGRYRTFARGLIGAGWAALYATSYAIYAVPEARIVRDPFVGSIGVLAVATGMILHSLRYRSQAITVVGYFAAFAAIAVTPSSPFAVIALIPLAASLLYLAWRFDWHAMALFGLAATYLTCISRGSSDASLASTQCLFLAYWLLFEAFDLLRVRRRLVARGLDLLFPINTLCFLGLSYLTWAAHAPARLWLAASFAAALFLADSLARALVRPPATFAEDVTLVERLRAGSFEGAFFTSAVLAGLAVVGRVPGLWAGVGLAMEAEIVYLAGLRLRSSFLRHVGARAFVLSVLRTLGSPDAPSTTVLFGHSTWNWTPPLLFHALLFYVNRGLSSPNVVMSSGASLIVAAVLAAELPLFNLGAALILVGLILFEIGLRKRLIEFRVQAWLVLVAGAVVAGIGLESRGYWFPQAIGLAMIYGTAVRARWIEDLAPAEKQQFAGWMSVATAVLAVLLAWRLAPPAYLGLVLWLLAVAVLELGGKRLPQQLKMCFGLVALCATGAVAVRLDRITKFPEISVWSTYVTMCLAALAAAVRFTRFPPPESEGWERTILRDGIAALACGAGLVTVGMLVPDPWVTAVWTVIAVAVLEIWFAYRVASFRAIGLAALLVVYVRVFGFDLAAGKHDPAALTSVLVAIAGMYWVYRRSSRALPSGKFDPIGALLFWAAIVPVILLIGHEAGLRDAPLGWGLLAIALLVVGARSGIQNALLQSYGIAGLAFGGALLLDVDPPRIWISGLTAALLYAGQYLAKRSSNRLPLWAAAYFSLLGAVLTVALLYGRASGGLLTVSWGMLGLVLLGFGFAFRERILRLQGLGLLLVCIFKLFLYDLRNLETIYRILSFVVLGFILLGVSWIYSRFRENVLRLF